MIHYKIRTSGHFFTSPSRTEHFRRFIRN